MMRTPGERAAVLGSLVARVQRCVTASTGLGGVDHRHLDLQLRELEADVEAECDRLTSETLTREHAEKVRARERRRA